VQGQIRNCETSVVTYSFVDLTHQILIHQRWTPTSCLIVHILSSSLNIRTHFLTMPSLITLSPFFFSSSTSTYAPNNHSLRLIVQPQYFIQHSLNNPVPRMKRQRSLTVFWFYSWPPKDIITLSSHRLATSNNVLHCLSPSCKICRLDTHQTGP